MWLLYQQAKDLQQAPSQCLGLTQGSYEAFCLDQAVWYLGSTIQNRLEMVGHKPAKGEASANQARQRELKKILEGDNAKAVYADPAALFFGED